VEEKEEKKDDPITSEGWFIGVIVAGALLIVAGGGFMAFKTFSAGAGAASGGKPLPPIRGEKVHPDDNQV